eukprot:c27068_g1_i11 orf=1-159(-)
MLPTRIHRYVSTIVTEVASNVSKQSLVPVDIFALLYRGYHSKTIYRLLPALLY